MLANKIYIGVIESFGLSIQSKTIPSIVEEVDEKFLNYIKDFRMNRDIKEALKLNLTDTIKNNRPCGRF